MYVTHLLAIRQTAFLNHCIVILADHSFTSKRLYTVYACIREESFRLAIVATK